MFKRPILNTIAQIIGKVITVLISLVTTSILTRRLNVSSYGQYMLVTSVFVLIDSLADFGSKVIGVRDAAAADKPKKNYIFIQIAWIRLLTTGISFVLGLLIVLFWQGFSQIRLEAVIALTMIWFTSLAGSLEIIFQTNLRMDLKVLGDIVFPLLFLILLLLNNSPISLLWVFSVYLLARILSLTIGFGLIRKIGIYRELTGINWQFTKKFLQASWPMGVYLIVFAGYDRAVDSLMIQKFVGIAPVAWYGLAYKIYSNLVQPAYFFVNSIFPILSSKTGGKRYLFKVSAVILIVAVLVGIPIVYFLAPWIIGLLAGSNYSASIGVLRLLLIALFFSYIQHLIGFTLISRGGQKDLLSIGITALIFNVVANFIAIPRFGINGAAIVTGLTECLAFLLMSWRLVRSTK